jgi:hypothetical protein
MYTTPTKKSNASPERYGRKYEPEGSMQNDGPVERYGCPLYMVAEMRKHPDETSLTKTITEDGDLRHRRAIDYDYEYRTLAHPDYEYEGILFRDSQNLTITAEFPT